ncbi:MAG TPA: hypothetical protein PLY26_03245, partial [Ferruginibacter sp.]|nr:hypothetical protein [Ferruginibacter sp.]
MALRIECGLRARQVVRARPHPSQTASIHKNSIIQKTFPAQDSAAHKKIFWPHLSDLGSVHRQFLWMTSAGNVVAQTHTNILSRGGQLSAPFLSRDNSCQNTLFSQNLIRDFEANLLRKLIRQFFVKEFVKDFAKEVIFVRLGLLGFEEV